MLLCSCIILYVPITSQTRPSQKHFSEGGEKRACLLGYVDFVLIQATSPYYSNFASFMKWKYFLLTNSSCNGAVEAV